MKQKIITFLVISLYFNAFSQKTLDDKALKQYKTAFDSVYYLYSNYCKYSRKDLYSKLYSNLKIITDTKCKDAIKDFKVIDYCTKHMVCTIFGKDGEKSQIKEAKDELKDIMSSTGPISKSKLKDYNFYFFNKNNNTPKLLNNLIAQLENDYNNKHSAGDKGLIQLNTARDNTKLWTERDYSNTLSEIHDTLSTLITYYNTLCTDGLGRNIQARQCESARGGLKQFKNDKYLSKDYPIILKLFSFFETLYRGNDPKSKVILENTVNSYNAIVQSKNAIKYPTINDYNKFFNGAIFKTITNITENYKKIDSSFKCNVDTFFITNNPCNNKTNNVNNNNIANDTSNTFSINESTSMEKEDTLLKNEKDTVVFFKPKLHDNVVINFKNLNKIADSSFFLSKTAKTILITN